MQGSEGGPFCPVTAGGPLAELNRPLRTKPSPLTSAAKADGANHELPSMGTGLYTKGVASFLYGTHYERTCVQAFIRLCVWKEWKGVGEPLRLILTVAPEFERREVAWYLED